MEYFYKLPSIGTMEFYLGGCYQEYEKEVNDQIESNGGEDFIYFITIKDGKLNYIRLGSKFTIGKNYSIIKMLDKSDKLVTYKIKDNGVIIKK
jgi:hypothetical protein